MDGGAWWAAVHGVAKSQTRLKRLHFDFSLSCIGEGNGNPLQCFCLVNPRDGGACWASISGVAQSRTWLEQLSSSSSSSTDFTPYTAISLLFKTVNLNAQLVSYTLFIFSFFVLAFHLKFSVWFWCVLFVMGIMALRLIDKNGNRFGIDNCKWPYAYHELNLARLIDHGY